MKQAPTRFPVAPLAFVALVVPVALAVSVALVAPVVRLLISF